MASPGAPGEVVSRSGVRVPASALRWRFSRSGGPGGQHANKADTRVELIVDLTELAGPEHRLAAVRERLGASLRIVASSERSQAANREEALRRLAARLERASRLERPRRATRPPASAVETRLEDKRRRSALKAGRRAADQE